MKLSPETKAYKADLTIYRNQLRRDLKNELSDLKRLERAIKECRTRIDKDIIPRLSIANERLKLA